MALNPLIALQGQVPDIGQTFSNVLLNLGRIEDIRQARAEAPVRQQMLAAQAAAAEAAVPTGQERFNLAEQSRVSSLATGARRIIPDLQSGDLGSVTSTLQRRRQSLQAAGLQTDQTDEAIALAQTDPSRLLRLSQQAIQLEQQFQPARTAVQFGAQETFKDSEGNLFFGTTARNPQTGSVETKFAPIGGGVAQPIGRVGLVSATGETREEKLETERAQAEISIKKARGVERSKLIEKRSSDITKEMSQRNRDAARSERTLNQALTLAQQASQGLTGSAKLQLSRLVPGVDAADEAALDATLKQLALEQLQAFKGPTTDFEFGVTQAIAGGIGQSEQANVARVKSLKRAAWFNKQEFDQFERHKKAGGDPDAFRFNFGEAVKTKRGVFTLQDIQDTAVQRNLTIEETIKRLNQ